VETKFDGLWGDYFSRKNIRRIRDVFLDTSLGQIGAVCVRGMGMMRDNKR
jgi:hypothetical protein